MADLGPWIIGWVLGGAGVLITAVLLIAILVTAHGIDREAARALRALQTIETRTKAIWILGRTAKRFGAVRDYFEALRDQTARLRPGRAGESGGGER